ncbi:MAG: tRNA preQ1(34) S-adenosylmethionine ribosyltransferase-isomerase QueA [Desulfobacter sp.]|nr:tRNA preQ1(34) S-adenosylmethionine ribosyltransferase-isomerase QueA [Desulfobacter sp.]
MYQLSDYDYDLLEELIAQTPAQERTRSRLLGIHRQKNTLSHQHFSDIEGLLRPNDLLVVNNTRVIPARLMGKKETGGQVEILIIDYAQGLVHLEKIGVFQCECLIRASRRPRPGARLFMDGQILARVVGHKDRISIVAFDGGDAFLGQLKAAGQIPLPPYIKRSGDTDLAQRDKQDYQTVYAQKDGAVAAPTAGLHFTDPLIERLAAKGVKMVDITLHVGYGTFVPVQVDDIRDHQIHSESFTVSPGAAEKINQAKKDKHRVIAVGTTSVRTLEYIADDQGFVTAGSGLCDLFIYPGYKFKCVDAMFTNFHLPKSTLLMLISAFYSREKILDAYRTAVAEKYRFFSYGDAMFIQ